MPEYFANSHIHVNTLERGYVFTGGLALAVALLLTISEVDMKEKIFALISWYRENITGKKHGVATGKRV